MHQAADSSHEEVRQSQPCECACEVPQAPERVRLEADTIGHASAYRDLVRAAHQREIVGQLRGVRHKPARSQIRDPESALNAHAHDVGVVATRRRPDRAGRRYPA